MHSSGYTHSIIYGLPKLRESDLFPTSLSHLDISDAHWDIFHRTLYTLLLRRLRRGILSSIGLLSGGLLWPEHEQERSPVNHVEVLPKTRSRGVAGTAGEVQRQGGGNKLPIQ